MRPVLPHGVYYRNMTGRPTKGHVAVNVTGKLPSAFGWTPERLELWVHGSAASQIAGRIPQMRGAVATVVKG
jgi:hypothetical protein